jgi:hypothetical protein
MLISSAVEVVAESKTGGGIIILNINDFLAISDSFASTIEKGIEWF